MVLANHHTLFAPRWHWRNVQRNIPASSPFVFKDNICGQACYFAERNKTVWAEAVRDFALEEHLPRSICAR